MALCVYQALNSQLGVRSELAYVGRRVIGYGGNDVRRTGIQCPGLPLGGRKLTDRVDAQSKSLVPYRRILRGRE